MKKLEPYPIASALFFIFTVLYIVCISVELILPNFGISGFWHMHKIWEVILPWFNGLDSLSIVIGLLEGSFGSYLIGYILVQLYNLLTKKKVSEHKIEVKPIIVRFKSLFITFAVYISVLFTLCLVYDLFVPAGYKMTAIWKILLPGFTGLTFPNYLFGLLDIIGYSAYTAFIFSKTINNYEKSELKKLEVITFPQADTLDKKLEKLSETELYHKGGKYNDKYFGIAAGTFTVIIYLLALIKTIFSTNDPSTYLKPFIPFFISVNAANIIGGIIVSFLWGWLIGYLLMIFYHWFDKSSHSESIRGEVTKQLFPKM